jgi:hypothetical protein
MNHFYHREVPAGGFSFGCLFFYCQNNETFFARICVSFLAACFILHLKSVCVDHYWSLLFHGILNPFWNRKTVHANRYHYQNLSSFSYTAHLGLDRHCALKTEHRVPRVSFSVPFLRFCQNIKKLFCASIKMWASVFCQP